MAERRKSPVGPQSKQRETMLQYDRIAAVVRGVRFFCLHVLHAGLLLRADAVDALLLLPEYIVRSTREYVVIQRCDTDEKGKCYSYEC